MLTALEHDNCKDISKWFSMLDTPFTKAPLLDRVMAAKSSKSRNKARELSIDDVKAAINVALSLVGSASFHCNALRRTSVKDLISFVQDSDLLFQPQQLCLA